MNLSVSRETTERLQIYQDLLIRWNTKINLVAPSTIHELSTRHIDDSLQIAMLAEPENGIWADLGSGGGLPGIVLAIAFSEKLVQFVLIESDQRKAMFLRTVIRETNISNTKVIAKRIETIDPLNATYISARALAPMPLLMAYLDRHLAKSGQAWLMKGERWQSEIEDARKHWNFSITSTPSRTQERAAILKIDGISHV